MRTHSSRFVLLLVPLLAAACGGDSIVAEPLIDGNVVASFDGTEFTPINGYATVVTTEAGDAPVIVLGTGPIGCGSESRDAPPRGLTAAMRLPELAEGTYGNVFVQLYSNVDRFQGAGSNSGSVTITSVTDESVVGEVVFHYTDSMEREFVVDGTFEVVHCAY